MKKLAILTICLALVTTSITAETPDMAVEAGVPILFPLGEFSALSTFTVGGELQFLMMPLKGAYFEPVKFFADIQLLGNTTTVARTSLTDLGFAVGGEYKYEDIGPESLSFSGQLGLGGYLHMASGTWNASTTEPATFFDMFTFLAAGAHWNFGDIGEAIFRIKYSAFLETENIGQLLGIQLAYRYYL